MRLSIRHQTAYAYARPARRAVEMLRLTPRGNNAQFVVNWRVDVDKDCRLQRTIDPFGNTLHTFTAEGPLEGFVITAEGAIETQDTSGVVTGQIERFPPHVFLRETELTAASPELRDFADAVRTNSSGDRLAMLHDLTAGIHDRLVYEADTTGSGTGATEAFALGRGVCQDFAHIFIAAARHLDIPARYVSGYMFRNDGQNEQSAGHAWAEGLVEGLGWVGFDPANALCPTDAYVRVAIGLDALGAAPVRGARLGGDGEVMAVKVKITNAESEPAMPRRGQSQRQSQS